MRKIFILIFVVIFLLILFLIVLLSQKNALLIIDFDPSNVNLKINKKEYLNIDKFEKKLKAGNYEIEVSKEDYETHKQQIILKKRERKSLKITLTPSLEAKKEILLTTEQEINRIFEEQYQFDIKVLRVEGEYAEVIAVPITLEADSLVAVLKKIDGKWKVVSDFGPEEHIEKTKREELGKTLPYKEDSFEVQYLDTEDAFLVIIKKEPVKKTMEKAKNWFKKQGLDPEQTSILWASLE